MDYKQKSEEFRVSIRRRNVQERMAVLRAKQNQNEQLEDPKAVAERMEGLLSSGNLMDLYGRVSEVKMAAGDKTVMAVLVKYFQLFYGAILEVDNLMAKQANKDEVNRIFDDLATILINITSEEFINVKEVTTDVATPLLANLKNHTREMSTLWLVTNLLYRHNQLSAHFMTKLVKWGVVGYLKGRLNLAFASETEMTIFYYFIGAYAANLDALLFPEYKQALEVLQFLAGVQLEEIYWYMLDGLIEHASSFSAFNYEIFGTTLLQRCDGYCKGKKSKFVIKYLELIAHFLQGESQLIYRSPEEQRRKLLSEQYERIKKNSIIKNLQFCLENRSPEVKRLLFENAYMLVALYSAEIQFLDEYFYLTLAEEIKTVQRYEERVIVWFLKFFNVLLSSLLVQGRVSRNQEHKEKFASFVEAMGLFDRLNAVMARCERSSEVLNACMDVVAFLLEYNIPAVNVALRRVNLPATLEKLEIQVMELSQKRDRLLDYLGEEGL